MNIRLANGLVCAWVRHRSRRSAVVTIVAQRMEQCRRALRVLSAGLGGAITGFLDSYPDFSFADDPADLNLLGSATARSVDSPRARDGGGRWPGTRVECEFDGSIVAGEIEHLYDGLRQPREAGK